MGTHPTRAHGTTGIASVYLYKSTLATPGALVRMYVVGMLLLGQYSGQRLPDIGRAIGAWPAAHTAAVLHDGAL